VKAETLRKAAESSKDDDETAAETEEMASSKRKLSPLIKANVDYDGTLFVLDLPLDTKFASMIKSIDYLSGRDGLATNHLRLARYDLYGLFLELFILDSDESLQIAIRRESEYFHAEKARNIQFLCFKADSKPLKVLIEAPEIGWRPYRFFYSFVRILTILASLVVYMKEFRSIGLSLYPNDGTSNSYSSLMLNHRTVLFWIRLKAWNKALQPA